MPGSSKVAIFAWLTTSAAASIQAMSLGAKAIVEAGSLQAIAMGHFDGVDPALSSAPAICCTCAGNTGDE